MFGITVNNLLFLAKMLIFSSKSTEILCTFIFLVQKLQTVLHK